jgi:hypothetical protein
MKATVRKRRIYHLNVLMKPTIGVLEHETRALARR